MEIISNTGDQAIYGDLILSSEDFRNSQFAINPNPVKNELTISSDQEIGNLKIKIFNIEGKLLSTQNLEFGKQISVDAARLSNGIYFLNIEDDKGRIEVKRFIKE